MSTIILDYLFAKYPHYLGARQATATRPGRGDTMTGEVFAFVIFLFLCSAFLIGLMLQYARRINRLRNMVTVLSRVNELVPQHAPAPRKDV
ncbi:hypothetical protein [Rhodopseudomonas pseudopalustris]|nr:hypothetical protein [Rhodopseudomonas pseudopalustris]